MDKKTIEFVFEKMNFSDAEDMAEEFLSYLNYYFVVSLKVKPSINLMEDFKRQSERFYTDSPTYTPTPTPTPTFKPKPKIMPILNTHEEKKEDEIRRRANIESYMQQEQSQSSTLVEKSSSTSKPVPALESENEKRYKKIHELVSNLTTEMENQRRADPDRIQRRMKQLAEESKRKKMERMID